MFNFPVSKSVAIITVITVSAIQGAPAQAKDHKLKITVEKTMPKMKKFYGTDDFVPMEGNAATLEVYGQNGKYDNIGNLAGVSGQPWRIEAKCSLGRNLVKSWVESEGANAVAYDLVALQKQLEKSNKKGAGIAVRLVRGHAAKTVTTPIRVSDLKTVIDPVQVCNGELAERAAKTGKSRTYWQERGFVLRMDDAITAQARAQCVAEHKLGKRQTIGASAKAPLYIACMPSNLHGKPAIPLGELDKDKPKPRPAWAPKPKILPIASVYAKKCPASLRLEGQIMAYRSNTIRYRYRGTGWVGPMKSKQLKRGLNTLPLQKIQIRNDRMPTGTNITTNANAPDMQGQAWLEIIRTGENIVSKKTPYSIYCGKTPKRETPNPKPKKVTIGKIPVNNGN